MKLQSNDYWRYSQEYGPHPPQRVRAVDALPVNAAYEPMLNWATKRLKGEAAARMVPWHMLDGFASGCTVVGFTSLWLRRNTAHGWEDANEIEACQVLYAEKVVCLPGILEKGIDLGATLRYSKVEEQEQQQEKPSTEDLERSLVQSLIKDDNGAIVWQLYARDTSITFGLFPCIQTPQGVWHLKEPAFGMVSAVREQLSRERWLLMLEQNQEFRWNLQCYHDKLHFIGEPRFARCLEVDCAVITSSPTYFCNAHREAEFPGWKRKRRVLKSVLSALLAGRPVVYVVNRRTVCQFVHTDEAGRLLMCERQTTPAQEVAPRAPHRIQVEWHKAASLLSVNLERIFCPAHEEQLVRVCVPAEEVFGLSVVETEKNRFLY